MAKAMEFERWLGGKHGGRADGTAKLYELSTTDTFLFSHERSSNAEGA